MWGLAFKPNTDDIRFAPALSIVRQLLNEGAIIQAYDPRAVENCKRQLPEVIYCQDPYEAAQGAEAILVLTEWEEFREIDWQRLVATVERPLVIDGRNALSGSNVARFGFQYVGIGGLSAGAPALASDSSGHAIRPVRS